MSVIYDLIGKRVLCATPGQDKPTWEAFVIALGEHNGHRADAARRVELCHDHRSQHLTD